MKEQGFKPSVFALILLAAMCCAGCEAEPDTARENPNSQQEQQIDRQRQEAERIRLEGEKLREQQAQADWRRQGLPPAANTQEDK